jgi:hypothetical protein
MKILPQAPADAALETTTTVAQMQNDGAYKARILLMLILSKLPQPDHTELQRFFDCY